MKYECFDCGKKFDHPRSMKTTHEDFYGVGNLFEDKHTMFLDVCPYCKSNQIDECEEEEDDDGTREDL